MTTTTRRALLARSAAIAAAIPAGAGLALAAGAAGDDAELLAAVARFQAAQAAADVANADAALDEPRMDEDLRFAIYQRASDTFKELLSQKPATVAGCVAMLRAVQMFGDKGDAHLFEDWHEPMSGPGATLLGRLADAIEAAGVAS